MILRHVTRGRGSVIEAGCEEGSDRGEAVLCLFEDDTRPLLDMTAKYLCNTFQRNVVDLRLKE